MSSRKSHEGTNQFNDAMTEETLYVVASWVSR